MPILKHKYGNLSDEKLMEFIQRKDASAFDELYNRYSNRLLFYFFRELGGNQDKAQDFLQEIFLKIVEKPELFDSNRSFSTWIFTVAYNLCKNEYRRLGVREIIENNTDIDEISLDSESEQHPIEQKVDQKIFEKALLDELDKLDDGHRSAFLLRYQQNLSIKEVSDILECSEGTIKSRLFYTTKKLAVKLKAFNPSTAEVKTDERTK
ncbi:MAG: RNA polymerase sigma factor [Candidatus Zixiibacteriota bacterium]